MIETIARKIEAKVDDFVIEIVRSDDHQLKFANSQPTIEKRWREESLTLFLAKGKKVVCLSTQDLRENKVKEFVKNALKLLRVAREKKDYHGIASDRLARGSYDKRDKSLDFFNPIEAVERVRSEIEAEFAGVLNFASYERELLTSSGARASESRSFLDFSLRVISDETSAHASTFAFSQGDLKVERAISEVSRLLELAKGAKLAKLKAGKYDVLFHPMAFANLCEHLACAASAFYVLLGESFLCGKLGKRVASSRFTLHDLGSAIAAFDEEGRRTQRTRIIENGVLKNYLHNTSTAIELNASSTSNAGLLVPRAWLISVAGGNERLASMLESSRRLIFINNVWYTRFTNYRTGEFSTLPRDVAILFENGEVKGLVKNLRITASFPRLLKGIEALSKERLKVKWWEVETPSIVPYALVREVSITKPF